MKVKNFNDFLFEWGYGGEGGVASKDPIKVKSSMFTEIDLDEEEEDLDEDVPILKESNEDINKNNIDPYGEEDWEGSLPDRSYKNWNGSLYNFLVQLKNPFIDERLKNLENVDRYEARGILNEILDELSSFDSESYLRADEFKAVEDDIHKLEDLCLEDEDEDPPEADPDYWYQKQREEEGIDFD